MAEFLEVLVLLADEDELFVFVGPLGTLFSET